MRSAGAVASGPAGWEPRPGPRKATASVPDR